MLDFLTHFALTPIELTAHDLLVCLQGVQGCAKVYYLLHLYIHILHYVSSILFVALLFFSLTYINFFIWISTQGVKYVYYSSFKEDEINNKIFISFIIAFKINILLLSSYHSFFQEHYFVAFPCN